MMAKIHPRKSMTIDSSCQYSSSRREIFTVWMKSLVINSNGCTVFSTQGEVVFRVDNYQTRRSRQVLLMNSYGEVLFSVKRKNLQSFRSWEGHKLINSKFDKEGEWFKVKRKCNLFRGGVINCHVTLGCNKITSSSYKIVGLEGKSTLKIMDCAGRVLAEVNQKQSLCGVSLGDDVLSLMVEPEIDQSFIMALVIVYVAALFLLHYHSAFYFSTSPPSKSKSPSDEPNSTKPGHSKKSQNRHHPSPNAPTHHPEQRQEPSTEGSDFTTTDIPNNHHRKTANNHSRGTGRSRRARRMEAPTHHPNSANNHQPRAQISLPPTI
ncbi:protein lurp-one-related 11 [Phtheirospermum japonicum]|uniref:Protein lurp-one-related 11 n=1 Tax=Phtheirospermum japonicum TaxID=374723 RepID=A0A830BBS3_9LAMI|nr:protein lurp-one-related 11 [Phtheirospermum japonicum]